MQKNKKLNTASNTATPYDDVHRTMINDCPTLIIPVVNEMFHKKHSDNEKIIAHKLRTNAAYYRFEQRVFYQQAGRYPGRAHYRYILWMRYLKRDCFF